MPFVYPCRCPSALLNVPQAFHFTEEGTSPGWSGDQPKVTHSTAEAGSVTFPCVHSFSPTGESGPAWVWLPISRERAREIPGLSFQAFQKRRAEKASQVLVWIQIRTFASF